MIADESLIRASQDLAARKAVSHGTLIDLLRQRALEESGGADFVFLGDGESQEVALSYKKLDQRARIVANWLEPLVKPGERVLLIYPPGLEYLYAFFGCLYAGVIAVPAYPPSRHRGAARLESIIVDATPSVTLTTQSILARVLTSSPQSHLLAAMHWGATDTFDWTVEPDWKQPDVGEDDLAFLQYTSGSTGAPKGVMLTHQNLLHNAALVHEACEHTTSERYVSWLPTFHDMGFMAGILQPIYGGFPVTLISPASFLQRPLSWLQTISRYRATTSGGPNFAYDLCVRKISDEERDQLDLSSWTVAFNGAEPIRSDTLQRFSSVFASCGFRAESFYPCYGLAEATLMVSGDRKLVVPITRKISTRALEQNRIVDHDEPDEDQRILVSCGRTRRDQILAVVNPDTLDQCAVGEVGEICVSGSSVARGYFNRPVETAEVFGLRLPELSDRPFLRTGDLGFIQDGELFITGRLKDLVIVRGRNHYPQDLELTVEQCDNALRPGCGAAFAVVIEGEERLIVVQEVDQRQSPDLEALIADIRRAIAEEHEIDVHAVVLIQLGSIAKTTSGKIQRHVCRAAFLNDGLQVIAEWRRASAPESKPAAASPSLDDLDAVQSWLRHQLATRLDAQASEITLDRPLSEYGLDSLAAIELAHTIETTLGVCLSPVKFLKESSLAELAVETIQSNHSPIAFSAARENTRQDQQLSQGQKAIWFMQALAPESTAYNIASAVRIRSELNVEALRHSFQAVLDRHPALRTTFKIADGEPVQCVRANAEVNLNVIEALKWDDDYLKEKLEEAAQQTFNLSEGPLHRIALYTRSASEHTLLLVMHHIVTDFWSLAVLMNEASAFYDAEIKNTPIALPEPQISYADYIEWQKEMLDGDEGQRLWQYWEEQLATAPAMLALPTDRPRSAMQRFAGASQNFELDAELARGLRELAVHSGATLYTTLLAAFQTLLYRYTGQKDIVIGSPVAGRNRAALAGLIGYFINPVALRATFADDPTFANLLQSTRKTVLAALEHQDYPFNLLVERLRLTRDLSRTPLFQVMFVFQNIGLAGSHDNLTAFALQRTGAQAKLNHLSFECLGLDQGIAQFDLTLIMAETESGLGARIEYNTDLFTANTISRLVGHFKTLLRGITNDPELRVSELPLLTPEEQRQLTVEWNDNQLAHSVDQCIHQLFERQVQMTPDATAVIFAGEELSYKDLNARANRLAHHLRKLGVGPEIRVGILLPRSIEMIVGLLAVLKAGGAYVPLDPVYPPERLAYMLADSQAQALITLQDAPRSLVSGVSIVRLDADQPCIECESVEDPIPLATPENLAYVIYTSGSTGQPKGVGIEHRSTVAFYYWSRHFFNQTDLAGTLASTSICFDLSVFEIFIPLGCGGTVILAEDILQLASLPAAARVTLVNTVPSAMTELLNLKGIPPSVRVVNLAGEQLHDSLVQRLYQFPNVARVVNLYGPTEDTTYSTFALLSRAISGAVPIGRPIANTETFLLDERMQPVPIGVTGEIYLGGAGLARGYLQRADLTAARFVPNPFARCRGERLYRTGDQARYLPDGSILYLGRDDRQVKLRGYRIELDEIETVLCQHEAIDRAVVTIRETAGDRRLVAYVVPRQQTLAVNDIRNYLKQHLPSYMVPPAIELMESMPLTPNDKVDHRALPEPTMGIVGEREFVAPANESERTLAGIWTQLLGVEQPSTSDNFFELGGHSLLAVRLISRIREVFQLELTIGEIFMHPTIASLGAHIESLTSKGVTVSGQTIKRVSRQAYRKTLSVMTN